MMPWSEPYQVEQDLLLCLAMRAIFEDRFLLRPGRRGGTVLHKGPKLGTELISYNIDEMLATKMRALFQRKKGRDLFDLYWALSAESVYATFFKNAPPARATIQVAGIPRGAKVEISAIAVDADDR